MPSTEVLGWVVTAIGFLINMVELGTFKSFGVFIMPIQESLRGSFTSVGTAMAASHTICYILVPLVIILNEKYGARRLVIAGGVIMFGCFLFISLVQDVAQFSICMILFGFGVSLAYTPPYAALLIYFPVKPELPIGIVAAGSAFGMMIYPPLTEILIDEYGWRGTMLIFAAVNANICVFGALIKQPPADYVALVTDHRSQEQSLEIGASKLDVLRSRCTDAVKGLCKILALDVLWEEPKFTLYAFACCVLGVMYSAWMIYLVPHAVTRHIDIQQATLLSTAGGVGTLAGRILYGPILHREYLTPVQMFILFAITNFGAFMLDTVVAANYPGLLCLAVVNGASLGTMAVMFMLVSRQVLDIATANKAWGTMCVFFAVGEVAGGALAGFVYDISGSYDVTFLMFGGLSATIAVVLIFERLLSLCCDRQ